MANSLYIRLINNKAYKSVPKTTEYRSYNAFASRGKNVLRGAQSVAGAGLLLGQLPSLLFDLPAASGNSLTRIVAGRKVLGNVATANSEIAMFGLLSESPYEKDVQIQVYL
eukprot:6032132-Pleurochrysis_carterae.AAC.3